MELFLTSQVVLYCVKRSLHKHSMTKLFTQEHWSHSQSHSIMDFKLVEAEVLLQNHPCTQYKTTCLTVISSHFLAASPAIDI